MTQQDLRAQVRDRYARAALAVSDTTGAGEAGCCGGSCGATGLEAVLALAFLTIWRQIRRRRPVY